MNVLKHYKFIGKIKALPFVEKIYLFGSRARGDYHDLSDIDLAVFCPSASIHDWLKVKEIIENADTLLKIDCVRLDTLNNGAFYNRIMEEKIILYDKTKSN